MAKKRNVKPTIKQRVATFIKTTSKLLQHCASKQDAWWDQGRIGANLDHAVLYLDTSEFKKARYVINKWGDEVLLEAFDKAFPEASLA